MGTVTPISKDVDWPPEQILETAAQQKFDGVVIVGWLEEPDENGKQLWVSSSYHNGAPIIYALRCAERLILNLVFGEEEGK